MAVDLHPDFTARLRKQVEDAIAVSWSTDYCVGEDGGSHPVIEFDSDKAVENVMATIEDAGVLDLLTACQAALAYDAAIQRQASKPGCTNWVEGNAANNLDRLYEDWMEKVRAAIAKAEGVASDAR
jgi:hypothetical protein